MDEFKMPESSAGECVNVAKSNSIGLIWYCKEDDSFELDAVLYVGKKTLIKRVPFEEYINRATEV